jgi:hypothetical protein
MKVFLKISEATNGVQWVSYSLTMQDRTQPKLDGKFRLTAAFWRPSLSSISYVFRVVI